MVEPTHLKNINQIGNLPQIGVKIKNIWKHHLVLGPFWALFQTFPPTLVTIRMGISNNQPGWTDQTLTFGELHKEKTFEKNNTANLFLFGRAYRVFETIPKLCKPKRFAILSIHPIYKWFLRPPCTLPKTNSHFDPENRPLKTQKNKPDKVFLCHDFLRGKLAISFRLRVRCEFPTIHFQVFQLAFSFR